MAVAAVALVNCLALSNVRWLWRILFIQASNMSRDAEIIHLDPSLQVFVANLDRRLGCALYHRDR